jgi:hypothetical protein
MAPILFFIDADLSANKNFIQAGQISTSGKIWKRRCLIELREMFSTPDMANR